MEEYRLRYIALKIKEIEKKLSVKERKGETALTVFPIVRRQQAVRGCQHMHTAIGRKREKFAKCVSHRLEINIWLCRKRKDEWIDADDCRCG